MALKGDVSVPVRGMDCIFLFLQFVKRLSSFSPREGYGLHRASWSDASSSTSKFQSP